MRALFYFILIMSLSYTSIVNGYQYETAAKQAILIDGDNGQILFAHNATEPMHPSSMTKIMTTYIAFEALKNKELALSDTFVTSAKAWKMEGSRMFLNYGDIVSVDDLLKGVIVQSGNDACIVLAEGLHGDEGIFVTRMNTIAQKLHMTQTNFTNSTGLPDPINLSTAKDLSKLAVAIIKDFPEYYDYHKLEKFTYGKIIQFNRNTLLTKLGVDGIKTGHTEAGGYGIALSAFNKDRRLIAVINGLQTNKMRVQEGEKILNYGFNAFKYVNILSTKNVIAKTSVQYGNRLSVDLVPKNDLKMLSNERRDKIECILVYKDIVKAPIKAGDAIGSAKCLVDNIYDGYIKVDLVASEDIKNSNFIQKVWQNLELFFMSI